MTEYPYPQQCHRGLEDLMGFLQFCQAAAVESKHVKFASITLEVDYLEPLAVLQSVAEPGQRHFFLQSPGEGSVLGGADLLWSAAFQGPERFAQMKLAAQEVWEHAIWVGDCDEAYAGLNLFFDYPFEADGGAESFADAELLLMRWQVLQQGGRYFASANVLVDADSDLQEMAARILGAHAKFAAFDYGQMAAQVGSLASVVTVRGGDKEAYVQAVQSGLAGIEAGDFEKIVLSRREQLEAQEPWQSFDLVHQLRKKFPRCYAFSLTDGEGAGMIGATPEKLVRVVDGVMSTEALAGTMPRSGSARQDALWAQELLASVKNRDEQSVVGRMIVESLEALGLQVQASRAFQLVQLANVQHLRTEFLGDLPLGVDLFDLIACLHPTPAVGGYPQYCVQERIGEIEGRARGLYTGGLGLLNFKGDGESVVVIRCALLEKTRAILYAGAGIVAASDPVAEYEETDAKLSGLRELFEAGG